MKINIIGRGRVATHLRTALLNHADIVMVNPHTLEYLDSEADLTLISVSDNAIQEIIHKLPEMKGIVAHTSGSTDINVFRDSNIKKYGVFYPLQTFSFDKSLVYSEIPFFIEGSDHITENKLMEYAGLISPKIRTSNSSDRKNLHIASVFSCNFVNHLWVLADEYLTKNGLQFSDLLPLLEETVNKIKSLSPWKAQTGPAVRNDTAIIDNHIEALNDDPDLQSLYSILSRSISNSHNSPKSPGNERNRV
ncbi:MAG: DUF2520 domain-containing protein [Muribaculaceae bacterium]|nr:DUF2520 domain-containing protein [Muribaculaceae bacterium]